MTATNCPRCNKPVIEARDFGPAGKLYIHSYTEERLNKRDVIKVPNGCRLTAEEVQNGPAWTHDSEGISR